jgi:hypothetical protein
MRTSIKFYLATNNTSKSDNTTPIYLRVVHSQKKVEVQIPLATHSRLMSFTKASADLFFERVIILLFKVF